MTKTNLILGSIIVILFIIEIILFFRTNNEKKNLENRYNLEYSSLKGLIDDYYLLPEENLRNQFISSEHPCGLRAFSQDGLIEYQTTCLNNLTYIKIPILYYEHPTTFYIYNGTLFPVIIPSLKQK